LVQQFGFSGGLPPLSSGGKPPSLAVFIFEFAAQTHGIIAAAIHQGGEVHFNNAFVYSTVVLS
jgi:hypothetical protein